jgi:hypothetical protein
VSRRVSLPGADELFRTTGGRALQPSTPRQHANGEAAGPEAAERLRAVPAPAAGEEEDANAGERAEHSGREADSGTDGAATARSAPEQQAVVAPPRRPQQPVPAPQAPNPAQAAAQAQQQPRRKSSRPNRRPSGRERHDEKITVYVSAEELMDLEHARLVLRGEHGLAVDRGRIVREAVAVVLADLESRGDASILVRRLRGR